MLEIWLGVLAVAGTLAGVCLGPFVAASREQRIWRRDRRADAYAALLSSVTAFEDAVTDDDFEPGSIVALALATEVRSARLKANVWGSTSVIELASAISSSIGELVFTRQSEVARDEARRELSDLRRKLTAAIRSDLGVTS